MQDGVVKAAPSPKLLLRGGELPSAAEPQEKPRPKPPDPDLSWLTVADRLQAYSMCADDRMVDPAILARVEERAGVKFSLDAACNAAGSNALCSRFATPDTFCQTDVAGEALWCCAPPQRVREYHQHYAVQKRKQPHSTCALFVVPKFPHLSRYFVSQRYTLLDELPAGTQLFVPANGSGKRTVLPMPPLPFTVQLWYDPPATEASLSHVQAGASHAMLFDTRILDKTTVTLVDSGADSCGTADGFTNLPLVQRMGLKVQPSNTASVRLADGKSQPILGHITIPIRIGPFRDHVRLLVMPTGLHSADVILGTDWLKRRGAQACWHTDTLTLRVQRGGNQTVVLTPNYARNQASPVPGPEQVVQYCLRTICAAVAVNDLSPKRAAKAIARGAEPYLFLVRPDDGAALPPPPPAPLLAAASAQQERTTGLVPQAKLDALLSKYKSVFDPITGVREEKDAVEHAITLVDGAQPPAKRAYRLSPEERQECKRQIADLLAKGFIEPSSSPFGAPVIFVKKKSGELRMVLDYRALNTITQKRRYPMPNIQELFDQLGGATVLSSIDLQSGYHQLRISESDRPMTAFITPEGQFQFKVLCFGLTNAPATFQAAMNKMFAAQLGKSVLVYLDDIIIYSRTADEHLSHLDEALSTLQQHGFKAKLEKCDFNKPELKFLGHIVGRHGLKVDPDKVRVVKDWPAPSNLKQLRRFLGLANYFRRFIQGYSSLVAPLTALTSEKTPWLWAPACHSAFEAVKQALITAPILALPDMEKPFEVWSDASLYGTGAVLFQHQRVIAYLSHRFTGAERNYTTTDQEALGVINALQEWRCYLEGAPDVTVVTDHQPLTHLLKLKADGLLSRRQARWIEYLQDKKVTWSYKPGRINVADPLSRLFEGEEPGPAQSAELQPTYAAMTRSAAKSDLPTRIAAGYKVDPYFKDPAKVQRFTKKGDLYYKDNRVVVPGADGLRAFIMKEHHDASFNGHIGPKRMKDALLRTYWWPRLWNDVHQYCASCPECQRNKASTAKPGGTLQPLPTPKRVWGSVTVDLITQLPATESGYDAIIVFVDRLSKMTHFAPTHSDVDGVGVAKLFVHHVFRHHGLPDDIVSDRGPQFAGLFWTTLHELLQTQVKLSTAYHPQTDGQTERMNRLLEETLRHYVSPTQTDWDTHLPLIEFAVNNARNASIGASPFELYSPHAPRIPGTLAVPRKEVPDAQNFASSMKERLQRATACLQRAKAAQKKAADTKRREVTLQERQYVWLSTKNISLKAPGAKKLLPRWIGPFPVLQRVGEVAYKLELPPNYRIHPVFHVSLLKPYVANGPYVPKPPAFLDDDGNPYWSVDSILQHRERKQGSKIHREYLVCWEGFGPEHNTWEPESNLRADLIVSEMVDQYLERAALRNPRRSTRDAKKRKTAA